MQISFTLTLDLPYEQAIAAVTEALQAEGFGVLTEIDVRATMKQKLGVDFRRYVILGACNPPIAHQALSEDLGIGIFMPCNVVVYETDAGGSQVMIMNPGAMVMMSDNPALEPVAQEALARIERVVAALTP